MKPTIVVTGVSSGIGYDAVRYLSQNGYFVFGSVRSSATAAELENKFPDNFRALIFDVLDRASIDEASEVVAEHLGSERLRALVNNAGIAEGGPLQLLDDDRFSRQLEVGVVGTRNVTNAFLPLLGACPKAMEPRRGPPGKIINITSISGILNTPMNGAYCVAKHAVESLGEVYRRELLQYGIDVISIQPGPIESLLWDKNIGSLNEYAESEYADMCRNTDEIMREASADALPAEVVSRLLDRIIRARWPRRAYIVHRNRWSVALFAKVLPARLVDRLLWRRLSRAPIKKGS